MHLRIILNSLLALAAAGSAAAGGAQEPPAKRLASIVGVAVEEYGKAVDDRGRLTSAVELDEATGFLKDAQEVARRLTTADAVLTRTLLDSLAALAGRRVAPAELRALHRQFTASLGAAGALDLPSGPIDFAQGRTLFQLHCAACHGVMGDADGVQSAQLQPRPARLSSDSLLHDATPALLYRIVSVGVQGTAMPGWAGTLTPDQRWAVVSYVNTLRASDADRARGAALLASTSSAAWRQFDWQSERSDAQVAATLAASGVPAGDAGAVTAALRAAPEVSTRRESSVPADAARTVVRTLDDALASARTGDKSGAGDLAFDAYLAFEPLEGPARARDPNLVAAMERHFADFKGAVRTLDLQAAAEARAEIERGLPQVLELTETAASGWGAFFESLLIIVREGFEAILVIGAVVAFLLKTGNRHRLRDIWYGVAAGLVASAVMAVVISTVLKAMPASREIIEGGTMLLAVVVLFSVSYWLLSKVEGARWQRFIKDRVNAALSQGGTLALALVAFLAVFREGAETALFYQVLFTRTGSVLPVFGGLAVGIVILAVIFTLFYRFGVKIPLRPFFATTSALLYYLALVFTGKGIKELQEGNAVPTTPVPGLPHIEALGLYPTVETLAAQAVLVGLLLWALWKALAPLASPAADEEVEETAIPAEVAGRLAELTAKARLLQDRVVMLEQEIAAHERDADAHERSRIVP
ncbi:MAG: FTR1 family protein [Gemmatimonadaceae bacterium]